MSMNPRVAVRDMLTHLSFPRLLFSTDRLDGCDYCTCLPGRATAVTAGAWETDDKRRRRKRPTSAASMASVSSVWQSPTMRSSSRSPSAVRHAYTFQRLANFQYLIYMPIFIFFFFFLSVTTLEMNGDILWTQQRFSRVRYERKKEVVGQAQVHRISNYSVSTKKTKPTTF